MITSECRIASAASITLTQSPHHEKPAGGAVTRRLIEIESLPEFDAHIGKLTGSTDGLSSLSI